MTEMSPESTGLSISFPYLALMVPMRFATRDTASKSCMRSAMSCARFSAWLCVAFVEGAAALAVEEEEWE